MSPSPHSNPRVSVVIPCRNEVRHIEACVTSALRQNPPEGGFEVLLADGMSHDGTRELLKRLGVDGDSSPSPVNGSEPNRTQPDVILIDNPGLLVPSGLNVAIRAARGRTIVRMDAHTEYAPDYLIRCLETLERTGADNVGGPARTKADTYIGKAVAAAYHSRFSAGGALFHNPDYEGYVDTVTYGCWPREAFERYGYFDEELARNQDDEHNLRIVRGGGKIYQNPRIQSWYRPRNSLAALFKQYAQYGYWKVRVIQKHRLPGSWRHLVPAVFLFALMVLGLSSLAGLVWHVAQGHNAGHRGLGGDWALLPLVPLLFMTGLYGACLLTFSLITAARTEWRLMFLLPLAFSCYHFGYGFGFLCGVRDFVITRRGAKRSFQNLTR